MKDRAINLIITDKHGKQFKFETFKQLEQFATKEQKFWLNARENLSGYRGKVAHYLNATNYFQQIVGQLASFKGNLKSWDDTTLQSQINQHINGNTINQLAAHWFWHGHPFVNPWLEIAEKYGNNTADAFIEGFIDNKSISNINSMEYLRGAILAYEHQLQDESTLTKRRNSERSSISNVRSDLVAAKEALFKDIHEFQTDFHEWDRNTRQSSERLYKVNKKLGERLAKHQNHHFDAQMSEWLQNIEHLESTYQEKLRLEKPASYWNTKAKSYFCQGIVWSILLGIVLLSGIAGFGYLLLVWLEGQHLNIKLDSLQGAALFITTLSIYAFSIKALSKMVFSSFHLQRDAEEREQLTHVYLALPHEKEDMDSEARNIVLQALFSRADTGLLPGDSGPTMPGLHEIVKATNTK